MCIRDSSLSLSLSLGPSAERTRKCTSDPGSGRLASRREADLPTLLSRRLGDALQPPHAVALGS
eukprot:7302335-Alexandrium_andersonii.AAC.1